MLLLTNDHRGFYLVLWLCAGDNIARVPRSLQWPCLDGGVSVSL
jgi:hypothetical protein